MSFASTDLDPFSAEFARDPYPFYDRLRGLGPIFWVARHEIWAVARHADAAAILGDWETYCSSGGGGLTNYFKQKPWRPPSLILEVDPPAHGRTRSILTRVLSPGVLRKLKDTFALEAERMVRQAVDRGTCDIATELALAFPVKVVPDALGMPSEDRAMLVTYGDMVSSGLGPDSPQRQTLMSRADEVLPWITARCRRDALSPDGLGAQIYAAADAGEVTEDEAALLVRSFLSAGVDTTFNALAQTFNSLIDHPDQWALLRDDPTLARAAFEEALRFDASGQALFRTTTRAVDYGGVPVGKHEKVLLLLGSANRDPSRWDNADRYDIRRRTTGHLAFGAGIHGCVAQMMARMEAEALISAFARAVERFEETAPRVRRLGLNARGLYSLPVVITPKPH